tara:strand:+ start:3947 stop:4234 length:288 start_codon:yes stop_codon:yes gene_type:complete
MAEKTKIEKRLSKPEKVTNEQLNEMQTLVGDMNKGQFNLGNLELQKHRILHALAGLQDKFTLLRKNIEKEYGTDDVNIETGVINYKKDEQTNKKD